MVVGRRRSTGRCGLVVRVGLADPPAPLATPAGSDGRAAGAALASGGKPTLTGPRTFALSATLSGPAAASQLIWWALGPREPLRPHALQDWAGLFGSTAPIADVADRWGVTTQTLRNWRATVTHVAQHTQLPPEVAARLTRPTMSGQDHLGRRRRASLFGLTIQGGAPPPPKREDDIGLTRSVHRILAALGTISLDELAAAVNRSRSTRRGPIAEDELVAHLQRAPHVALLRRQVGLTRPVDPLPQDVALIRAAQTSGRILHTYDQITGLVAGAGYQRSVGPTLAYHPLLVHVRRGLWAVRIPGQTTRRPIRH